MRAPQQFNGPNFGDPYNGSAGGIVGNKYGGNAEITGCTSNAAVTSAQWTGGIIGFSYLIHSGDTLIPINTTYSGNTFTNAALEFGNQDTEFNMRGDGSESAPFDIHTSSDLLMMRDRFNNSAGYKKLRSDIRY